MAGTIYSHINSNKWGTFWIILMFPVAYIISAYVFSFLSYFMIAFLDDKPLYFIDGIRFSNEILIYLPWIVFAALIWIFISWFFGGKIILRGANAKEIYKKDNPMIYRLVENVAIAAGLPTPKVYIIEDESLNAFATGRDPEHSIIALTSGIINKLDKQELEGVIAHEMAHIGNRDIRKMMLIVAGIGFFTFVGAVLLRSLTRRRSRNSKDGGGELIILLIALFFIFFGYVIAPLIHFALSRKREYQADATAALITRNPEALANALKKISVDAQVESLHSNPASSAMCIENPLDKNKKSLFSILSGMRSTHPPIEKRIEALKQMAS